MSKTAKFLKKIRKEKNITQRELAKKIGVAHTTISAWESDVAQIPLEKAIVLSVNLNFNLQDILDCIIDDLKLSMTA